MTEQSTGDYIFTDYETLVNLVHDVLLRFWAISGDVESTADVDRTTYTKSFAKTLLFKMKSISRLVISPASAFLISKELTVISDSYKLGFTR